MFTYTLALRRPRPRLDVCCMPPALVCRIFEARVTISTFRVSDSKLCPAALTRPPNKFEVRSSFDDVLLDAFIFALL